MALRSVVILFTIKRAFLKLNDLNNWWSRNPYYRQRAKYVFAVSLYSINLSPLDYTNLRAPHASIQSVGSLGARVKVGGTIVLYHGSYWFTPSNSDVTVSLPQCCLTIATVSSIASLAWTYFASQSGILINLKCNSYLKKFQIKSNHKSLCRSFGWP